MSFGQHTAAFVKELAAVVIGALIVAALLRGFVGQMFIIPSESMEDTLQVQDRVLVEKLSSVKRGHVVVFEDPGGWLRSAAPGERGRAGQALEFIGLLPDTSTNHLIKRVIGLPGDHVVCCDGGRIVVNDRALDETEYLRGSNTEPPVAERISFDVVVPEGRVFVMGDNRANSCDSRWHLQDASPGPVTGTNAFVPEELIVGRAIAVVWPRARWSGVAIPATFASVPPGDQPPPAQAVVSGGTDQQC